MVAIVKLCKKCMDFHMENELFHKVVYTLCNLNQKKRHKKTRHKRTWLHWDYNFVTRQ